MGRVPQVGFADFLKKHQQARTYGTPFFADSACKRLDDQNAAYTKANRLAFMPADAKGKKNAPRTRGKEERFTGAPGNRDENGARKRRDVVPVKDYVEPAKAGGKRGVATKQLAAALQREHDERADSKSPMPDVDNEAEEVEDEVEAEIIETEDEMEDDEDEEELPTQRRFTHGMKAKENKEEIEYDLPVPRRSTRGMKVKEAGAEEQAIAASLEDEPLDIDTSLFEDAMGEEQAIVTHITEDTDVTGDTRDTVDTDDTFVGIDDKPADNWPPYKAGACTATGPTRFLGLARLPADFVDEFKALVDKQFTVDKASRCQFTSEPVSDSYPELQDIGIEFWNTVKDAEYAEWALGGTIIAGKKLQVVFAIEE